MKKTMNKPLWLVAAATALAVAAVVAGWMLLSRVMFRAKPPEWDDGGARLELLRRTDTPVTADAAKLGSTPGVAGGGDAPPPRNARPAGDVGAAGAGDNGECDADDDDDDDEALTPAELAVKEWEDLAESLREADFAADPQLARRIKTAFDALETDQDRVENMQAMMNLISDGAVQALIPILMDTDYDEDILDIIFCDILNRDDEIKYPVLEEIAKNPNHPNFVDAAHILEVTKPDEGPVVIEDAGVDGPPDGE